MLADQRHHLLEAMECRNYEGYGHDVVPAAQLVDELSLRRVLEDRGGYRVVGGDVCEGEMNVV